MYIYLIDLQKAYDSVDGKLVGIVLARVGVAAVSYTHLTLPTKA